MNQKTSIKRAVSKVVNAKRYISEKTADGAILSLTGYHNYGNIMQRYALQQFLKKNGYRFISYADSLHHSQANYVIPKKVIAKTPLRFAKRLARNQKPYWYIPEIKDIYPDMVWTENLINFVNKYIWQKPFNLEDKDNYRNYIVGSDQVWRNWYGHEQSLDIEKRKVGYYFLDFLSDKKTNRLSYAASFGKDNLEGVLSHELIKYVKPYIGKFDAISVRERSAINVIKKAWGRGDAVEVVDPTLLLGSSDYSKIVDRSSGIVKQDTSPIFYYILDMSEDKKKLIEQLSKYLKADYYGIFPDGEDVLPHVETWLKGFRDSEFAITDSFHGTVFSIINHTPFVVIGNEGRGLSRLIDLLAGLGLSDRLLMDGDIQKFDITKLKDIDWNDVQNKLDEKIRFSSDWLLSHLVK